MKFTKKMLAFIIVLALTVVVAYSQTNKVTTSIDTNKALIGDQINIKIKLFPNSNEQIIFPQLGDSLGKFTIVSKSKIDTLFENKIKFLTQKITITTFDTGLFVFPPLEYKFVDAGDTLTFLTDSYAIEYHTLAVDTTKPIKDIKPIMELPVSLMDYLLYIFIVLLVIALALGIYYYLKNRKPKEVGTLNYDPKIPPHIQALKDLNELERQKLWQKGLVKEYYSKLSDIIRIYLERRFNFLAMESTTNEIMEYFTKSISSAEITKQLRDLLELSDLVKFAKMIPEVEENSKMLDYARNIVQSTVPIETEENPQKQ